jgi:hypothetical protein
MHSLPIALFAFAVVSIALLSLRPLLTRRASYATSKDGSLAVGGVHRRPPSSIDPAMLAHEKNSPPVLFDLERLKDEARHQSMGGRMDRGGRQSQSTLATNVRLLMQVIISLIVLGGGLYIIISPVYDPKDKHWAYGSAGTILGFWLKH